jgi:hypothetical protein
LSCHQQKEEQDMAQKLFGSLQYSWSFQKNDPI